MFLLLVDFKSVHLVLSFTIREEIIVVVAVLGLGPQTRGTDLGALQVPVEGLVLTMVSWYLCEVQLINEELLNLLVANR